MYHKDFQYLHVLLHHSIIISNYHKHNSIQLLKYVQCLGSSGFVHSHMPIFFEIRIILLLLGRVHFAMPKRSPFPLINKVIIHSIISSKSANRQTWVNT